MIRISTGGARRTLARLSTLALLAASTVFFAPARAAVLGLDDRNGTAAFLTEAQQSRFEGVGRIECRQAGMRERSFAATGWIVAAADTAITAAHTFFRLDGQGRRSLIVDPRNCVFVLYNPDMSVREVSPVRYAISPWSDASLRGDSSQDFAVLKLERPLRISHIPVISGSARINPDVQLVAFQTGVLEDQRPRVTSGETGPFPVLQYNDGIDGIRITNASRLFSTSADSSPGSSGGLYYDNGTGSIFGIHLGSVCDEAGRRAFYDRQHCFNYGLRFNRKIHASIDEVVRDAPVHQQLIGRDAPHPTTMAMLSASIG